MTAISLAIVLVAARLLGGAAHPIAIGWWSPIAYLWHDAAIALVFAAFELASRRHTRVVWTVYAVVAAYAVFNIPVERALWSPLTPAMWRAAGGPLADSIRHYATWSNAGLVALGLFTIVLAPIGVRRIPAAAVFLALGACVALGPAASARVDTHGMERNAWTALARSALARSVLPRRALEAAPRNWRATSLELPHDVDLSHLRGLAARRNVILVSLESTAARYLGLYGAAVDVAPNLSDLARSGVVFENAYAVYPESIKGLLSTLCSIAPAFDTTAESDAARACESIPSTFHAHGYRTAMFHSGRFDYLGMNAVIRNRGYDVVADAGDIGGLHDSSFGVDEPSTVASILKWIDGGSRDRPFFVTYLPIAGHHPYETPERGPFPDPDEFGRYRNALHYGDESLGILRRGLQARGLDRDTLWIVFGDHGEAFGQHPGNYGHTFQIYDENVRVPYLIAAPGTLSGPIRAWRVVSLIDTAPTLLDLLGLPASRSHEGQSMLDARPRVALFFTDYSLPLVGLRDGPRKFIHDLRSGRSQWFDLARDPDETTDLSPAHAAESRRYAQTLEAWVARR